MTAPSQGVFLSYASEDEAVAQRICAALRAAGIDVWFDRSELRGGDAWDQLIRRQVRDCALFVPIVSAHTESRAEGYFRLEWRLADQRTHLMGRGRPFIVPVCVDDTREADADVPDSFLAVQWMRLPAGESTPDFPARVQQLLAATTTRATGGTPPTAHANEPNARRRRTAMLIALAILATGIAAFAVTRLWPSWRSTPASDARDPAGHEPGVSIAVLPFVDLSEHHDQEYFSDGLAEDVIDHLTRAPQLKVIARTSSFYFKGKQATVGEIARSLGVSHVLEGSVRKSGAMLKITAQLVRGDNGYHVWSHSYERRLADIFRVQEEIASNVARALQASLDEPRVPSGVHTDNTDAYLLFLEGRALRRGDGVGDFAAAEEHLTRAVTLDPKFAAAWAELGVTRMSDIGWHNAEGGTDPCAGARSAIERALQLDPRLSSAHAARAMLLRNCDWDWPGAETELKRALDIDPENADAWRSYSFLAGLLGRQREALRYAQRSASGDPLNGWTNIALGWALGALGRFEDAEAQYRRALALEPQAAGRHALIANALLARREPAAALAENELESDDQFRRMNRPLILDALGRRAEADRELAVFEQKYAVRDPGTIAEFYACRNDIERALGWSERTVASHLVLLDDVPNRTACFESIKHEPRYRALLAKMHFTG